jgi:diguanylate cyclase (GGDEF)-like protein
MKSLTFRLLPLIVAVAASIAILVAVLWQRSPVFALALAGPILALVLDRRSQRRSRDAMLLALTDPLTGLGNHRAFRHCLESELENAASTGHPLALCLLDVDNFKRVNDRHGHPVGDRVLSATAGCLRGDGEAFRLGGDEFALVLPERDAGEGRIAADSVIERLSRVRVRAGESVTVSVGLATFPEDGAEVEQLVDAADRRLYRAKRLGGNRVATGSPRLAPEEREAG